MFCDAALTRVAGLAMVSGIEVDEAREIFPYNAEIFPLVSSSRLRPCLAAPI
jgi:hypothetical protein